MLRNTHPRELSREEDAPAFHAPLLENAMEMFYHLLQMVKVQFQVATAD